MVDDTQGVFVVAEGTSVGCEGAGEGFFSCVTEGGVAEIVAEGDRLREIFVEPESAGYGTGYLHHLQSVREACPEVVAVRGDEDLGLVHEPAERLGVDYAVPITLEVVADTVGRLGPGAAYAVLYGPCGRILAKADTGSLGFHARRPARRGPTRVFPGAWARTWERTTLRTLWFGPVCAGASRMGFSMRVLRLSSVPGPSGNASPVAGRHSWHRMPPWSGAKFSGSEVAPRFVPQVRQTSSCGA